MQELPAEFTSSKPDQRVQERRRERDLNKGHTNLAPPRPRYEPSAPVYNPTNDVAPMVIDDIRRGKISDAERAHRFREDLCLYCGNAGHHRDHSTFKTKKANISAYSGSNPTPASAACSSAISLSLKVDIRIDSDTTVSA
ncbi:hypothetical protein RI367_008843, partial [Sorochytrium milnesiophthora]